MQGQSLPADAEIALAHPLRVTESNETYRALGRVQMVAGREKASRALNSEQMQ